MRRSRTSRGLVLIFSLACILGAASPATAQTATQTTAAVAPTTVPSPPVKAAPPAMANLTHADEFSTAAAATSHCPSDSVVWSTLSKSKAYHVSTSRYFGKTKHGAYVCEKEAVAAGFHAAKS